MSKGLQAVAQAENYALYQLQSSRSNIGAHIKANGKLPDDVRAVAQNLCTDITGLIILIKQHQKERQPK